MGIWIRSQDKSELHLIESFRIDKKDNKIIGATGFCVQYDLGKYKTEERAMQVLDEIQNHIATLEHNKMCVNSLCEQYNYEKYIFEVPKN